MPSLEDDTESELRALVGTTVAGKYRVDRLIGRGGMGAVFQATNLAIGKRVALKFLDHEAAKNREACQRFQREAEAAGMAESAHIVQIFDSGGTEAGLPFLVMELLTGEDLRARLRREGRLSVSAALRIASQVLRALMRAHAAGIVHRDLKPDNVFLCARDDDPSFVKIVDFGISKVARARVADTLTRRGTVLGTAFYMSPEQAQSFADIDGRTDLFSLGAILFEMLAGGPPQVGPTYEAVLISICTNDAADVRTRAPEVPARVAALVSKALERDRERRAQYAQADDRRHDGSRAARYRRPGQYAVRELVDPSPTNGARVEPLRLRRLPTVLDPLGRRARNQVAASPTLSGGRTVSRRGDRVARY